MKMICSKKQQIFCEKTTVFTLISLWELKNTFHDQTLGIDIYIKWHYTWDYSFKFRARFIVLSLGDPSRRLCYWTGWDPKEIVRAALSTDSFFEVWEVIAPSVNAEYVAMSMSWLTSVKTHPLTDTANRTAGAVCGWIIATHRLSATILPSLYDIIPLLVIHWRHQGVLSEEFQQTGC